MLHFDTFKVFDARDVFDAIQKKFGEDVEGEFCESYCPPEDGAVLFTIPGPASCEEWDEFEIYDKYVADILINEGGLKWGESCYIHFDF